MEAANYCMGCGCNVQSNECTPAISLRVPSTLGGGGRDGAAQMTSHMDEPRRNAARVGEKY